MIPFSTPVALRYGLLALVFTEFAFCHFERADAIKACFAFYFGFCPSFVRFVRLLKCLAIFSGIYLLSIRSQPNMTPLIGYRCQKYVLNASNVASVRRVPNQNRNIQ